MSTPENEEIKPPNDIKKITAASVYPEFINVIQFLQTFGPLLGIPKIPFDILEDGLEKKDTQELYYEACINSIERLLVCLLRRIGISSDLEKLTPSIKTFLHYKDADLLEKITEDVFRNLPNKTKLDILHLVCMSQFDDNQIFKTEVNSKLSPDDLRFEPIGIDVQSNQYWYISDRGMTHRLYLWKQPLSHNDWFLLSRTRDELQKVVGCLAPADIPALVQGKLNEVVQEACKQQQQSPPKPPPKHESKKQKKNVKTDSETEDDKNVQHRIKKDSSRVRKSSRNVNRKVYTEGTDDDPDNKAITDLYAKFKKYDHKFVLALDIARNRKRTKAVISNETLRTTLRQPPVTEPSGTSPSTTSIKPGDPQNGGNVSIHDSIISKTPVRKPQKQSPELPRPNPGTPYPPKVTPGTPHLPKVTPGGSHGAPPSNGHNQTPSKDPFMFRGDVVRSSETDGRGSGGRGIYTPIQRKTIIYRSPLPVFDEEFLGVVEHVPLLRNFVPPTEAADICWKCSGTHDIDKMLFCDGCDLATYHMACLVPPLSEIPEGDWFCPVCQQGMLYLLLRTKLRTLNNFAAVNMVRQKPRHQKHSANRVKTVNIPSWKSSGSFIKRSPTSTPSSYRPTSGPMIRHSTPTHAKCTQQATSPHIRSNAFIKTVERTVPAVSYQGPRVSHSPQGHPPRHLSTPGSRDVRVTTIPSDRPAKIRPRIRQINHLMETARKVYDHDFDDHSVKSYPSSRDGTADDLSSDEEEIIMSPDDVRLEADKPPPSHVTRMTVMRAQPKGKVVQRRFVRGRPITGSDSDDTSYSAEDFLMGASPTSSSNSSYHSYNRDRREGYHPRYDLSQSSSLPEYQEDYDFKPPTISDMAVTYEEGDYKSNRKVKSRHSGSGNVVTDTSHLNEAQRRALAAWEDMENIRKPRDAFEFDE